MANRPARVKTAVTRQATGSTQITMKLGALFQAVPGIQALVKVTRPQKVVYHVAKLARLVEAEVAIYVEKRKALIEEFGDERKPTAAEQKIHGPAPITEVSDPKKFKKFTKQLNELGETDVVINWSAVRLSELSEIDLSAETLLQLGNLIVLDVTDDEKANS